MFINVSNPPHRTDASTGDGGLARMAGEEDATTGLNTRYQS